MPNNNLPSHPKKQSHSHNPRLFRVWLFCLVFVCCCSATTIISSSASNTAISYNCTDPNKTMECEQLNRQCMVIVGTTTKNNDDEGKEVCGPCLLTFVEYSNYKNAHNNNDNDNNNQNPKDACIKIYSLNVTTFVQTYGATYRDPEQDRWNQLVESATYISMYQYKHPKAAFQLGLTKFSADTTTDYQHRSGFRYINMTGTSNDIPKYVIPPNENTTRLPQTVDWVIAYHGAAVTSVKDQGRCGGCWSISTVGAIEGAAAITKENNGYLQSLSFQQLLSCDKQDDGCNGGSLITAIGYSRRNSFGGVTTYGDYPYQDYWGLSTSECTLYTNKSLAVTIDEPRLVLDFGTTLQTFDERMTLMKFVLSRQPVAMTIKSSCRTLSNYRTGILTDDGDCACSDPSCIDHAVLMVGYNDSNDIPYWKIKNSWGTDWGEDGYFRVAQTQKGEYGLFGVLGHAVIPLVATNVTIQVEETTQKVPISVWKLGLIVLACLSVCLGCAAIVRLCFRTMSSSKDDDDDNDDYDQDGQAEL